MAVLQNERSIMVPHGAAVSVDAWEPTKASDAYPRMSILETNTGVGDRGNPVGMKQMSWDSRGDCGLFPRECRYI